jgi:hypothetical protein
MSCQAESSSADSGLHKAAIRMLFSWLTEKRVLAHESERAKTERFARTEGKPPAFVEGAFICLLARFLWVL